MTQPPFITFAQGEAVLDWRDLAQALAAGHSRPKAEIADSFLYRGRDTLLSRAAWIDGLGMAVKTATVFPGNLGPDLSTINGGVSLYDDATGTLAALVDFHLVTKWKTAADSLLGAQRLARPDSQEIVILGAGTVAASLIEAFGAGFPKARITLWNRTPARAQTLAARYPGVRVEEDLQTAITRACIIVSATMTTEPFIQGDWLQPGQHLNLIGAYRPDMREVDDTALRRATVYVDSFDTTLEHIGELRDPLARNVIRRDDVVADFYSPDAFVQGGAADITLFKNGGGAHLDLMTASHIWTRWREAQG